MMSQNPRCNPGKFLAVVSAIVSDDDAASDSFLSVFFDETLRKGV